MDIYIIKIAGGGAMPPLQTTFCLDQDPTLLVREPGWFELCVCEWGQ